MFSERVTEAKRRGGTDFGKYFRLSIALELHLKGSKNTVHERFTVLSNEV